jgi:hypothetical protein
MKKKGNGGETKGDGAIVKRLILCGCAAIEEPGAKTGGANIRW